MFKTQSLLNIDDAVMVSGLALEDALKDISLQSGVRLECGEPSKPQSMDPRYSFKTTVDISGIVGVSNATICFLEPGDGTGSADDYQNVNAKPNHVPRNKSGFAELMIPIGTFYNHHFVPHLVSLEEVVLQRKNLRHYGSLVMHPKKYQQAIIDLHEDGAVVYETTLIRPTFIQGVFGNPHATRFNEDIINNVNSCYCNWLQVAAFIALPKDNEDAKRLVRYSLRKREDSGIILTHPKDE
jgi:hypothetical protein